MITSFVGDKIKSNDTNYPMLKRNGECVFVDVTSKDGEWLTVSNGIETCMVSEYTVFVCRGKEK